MFFQRKEEPPKVRLLTASPLEDALAAGSIHSEEHRLFLFLSSRADRQRVRTSWEELALLLRRTRKQVLKSANKLRLAGLMRYPDQRGKAAGSVVTLRLAPLFEPQQPNVPPPPPPLPEVPRPVEPPRQKPRRPSFADYVQCSWEELFERRGHTLQTYPMAEHKRRKVEAIFERWSPRDLTQEGAHQLFENAHSPLSMLAWAVNWTEEGELVPNPKAAHIWRTRRKPKPAPVAAPPQPEPEPETPMTREEAAAAFEALARSLGSDERDEAPEQSAVPAAPTEPAPASANPAGGGGGGAVGAWDDPPAQRPYTVSDCADWLAELLLGKASGDLGGGGQPAPAG